MSHTYFFFVMKYLNKFFGAHFSQIDFSFLFHERFCYVSQNASRRPRDKVCDLVASRVIWTRENADTICSWCGNDLWQSTEMYSFTTCMTSTNNMTYFNKSSAFKLSPIYIWSVIFRQKHRNIPEWFRTLCISQHVNHLLTFIYCKMRNYGLRDHFWLVLPSVFFYNVDRP